MSVHPEGGYVIVGSETQKVYLFLSSAFVLRFGPKF